MLEWLFNRLGELLDLFYFEIDYSEEEEDKDICKPSYPQIKLKPMKVILE